MLHKLKVMYAKGLSFADIAVKVDKSKAAIFRLFKKHGLRTDPKRRKRTPGSRIFRNGYVFVKAPSHPRANYGGYVREHVLVAEKRLGRFLKKGEVVHHIDFNRLNNAPKNLRVMHDAAHKRLHALRQNRSKKHGN